MRRFILGCLLLLAVTVGASTPSYWWNQMLVKPDAQQAQQFWFLPGTNMTFTYANNFVYLNASGGGGGGTSNYYYYTTNFYTTNLYSYTTNLYSITTNTYTTNVYTIITNVYTTSATGTLTNILCIYGTNLYNNPANGGPLWQIGADDYDGTAFLFRNPSQATSPDTGVRLTWNNGSYQSIKSELEFFWSSGPEMFLWFDPGINVFANPAGGIAWSSGNAAVTLANGGLVTIGPSLVVSGTAFGNGIGITNAQFSSHVFTNGVLVPGTLTNLNIIGGSNIVVTGSNVTGGANITISTTGTASSTNVWKLNGNALGGTGPFLGSTDNQPLQFKVNNSQVGLFGINSSVALGVSSSASLNSSAVGLSSTAAGSGGSAFGQESSAAGDNSTAVGSGSSATKTFSTAVGAYASSTAVGATALGCRALASGDYAGAVGKDANGAGQYSIAFGQTSSAFGDNSFAFGYNSVANNAGSFVMNDDSFSFISDTGPEQFVAVFQGGAYFTTGGSAGGFNADWFQHYRAGNVAIAALATSKTITFTTALASANYVPTVTSGFALGAITMYCDTLATTGFTVHFSAGVGGGTLYYSAILNQ